MLRRFTQEDMKAYRRLMAVCYTYAMEEKEDEAVSEKQLRECYGVFGEDGSLKSAMSQRDFMCWFEGHRCRMLGIGGVVTDPTARKEGGVRRLFEEGLPRLYREGYVFSALYPFSHAFYRKFGYEYAVEQRRIRLETHNLRKDLMGAASIRRVLPEDDGVEVMALYEEWARRYNLAYDMSDCRKELCAGDFLRMKYAYVLYDESGAPISYWSGKASKGSDGAVLDMTSLAWKNRAGMEAIFAMLRGMNEIIAIKMTVPPGMPIRYLLDDPYNVEQERIDCGGMVRVMNVEKALALLPAPARPGKMVIEVQDGQIAENCGLFRISGDGEKLTVQKTENAAPDLRCQIGGLTVLTVGALALKDAVLAGFADIAETADTQWMEQVFVKRERYMNRDF